MGTVSLGISIEMIDRCVIHKINNEKILHSSLSRQRSNKSERPCSLKQFVSLIVLYIVESIKLLFQEPIRILDYFKG